MTENEILSQLAACKKEARELRTSHVEKKNAVLLTAAELLLKKSPSILEANAKDLRRCPETRVLPLRIGFCSAKKG